MLAEAIDVIRLLWKGGNQNFRGKHYMVDNARLYTLPDEPPPLYVAANGKKSATLAGKLGDGFIGVAPKAELLERFDSAGGRGKPRYGQIHVCWADSEEAARKTVRSWWPNAGLGGQLGQELKQPSHFEAATESLPEDKIVESVACGPDPERHLEAIREFVDAGYDHVYVHQIGPDQDGFFEFYASEVLPKIG
jgi:G6PDH family F420-dependent oxidoreductase